MVEGSPFVLPRHFPVADRDYAGLAREARELADRAKAIGEGLLYGRVR